jgi:predicted lipid-binding transport protein (Tim44 family)
MRGIGKLLSNQGATQLGFLDVLTALILLALLIWAASRQFPAYHRAPAPSTAAQHTASP